MGLGRWLCIIILSFSALSVASSQPKKAAPATILLFLDEEDSFDGGNVPAEVDEPDSAAWDEFNWSLSDEDLDPGSWSQVLENPSIWDTRNKQVTLSISSHSVRV